MPPEFIVPGEQGVPFGSGFQIGPQATEANSSEQATSSFIIGTKGIVAYTAFIEEGDQMVLLEVDCTLMPTMRPRSHTLVASDAHASNSATLYVPFLTRSGNTRCDGRLCSGTNIVSLGDKRIWGDAAAQPPLSIECEATDSDHSVVTFNVMRGAGTKRYWA